MPTPSFSRGGGGVSFEQLVGAIHLSHILTGARSVLFGRDATVESVTFQSVDTPVDDQVLSGHDSHGSMRACYVAVRHNPTIGPGDAKFVKLIGTFIESFAAELDDFADGSRRLGLVVVETATRSDVLKALTDLARDSTSADSFAGLVAGHRREVRDTRVKFVETIEAALALQGSGPTGPIGLAELAWGLLSALYVWRADVEGDQGRDIAHTISLLDTVDAHAPSSTGGPVLDELVRIVVNDNPTGATIDEATLRRKLTTIAPASARFATQHRLLDDLAAIARRRVQPGLRASSTTATSSTVELPRTAALDDLTTAATQAATSDTSLLVTGAADVGKSALTLRLADRLASAGATVNMLHARDVADLGTARDPFQHHLADALATAAPTTAVNDAASRPAAFLIVDGAEHGTADDRLAVLAAAAGDASRTLIVVTRDDVADDVLAALHHAARRTGAPVPHRHVVEALDEDEVKELASHIPALAPVLARPRAHELLSRPGITDIILATSQLAVDAGTSAGDLTELEVFRHYWERVIQVPRGPAAATGRDSAAVSVARRRLRPDLPPTGAETAAIDSLRSDGVLATASALSATDEFRRDIDLDFATVRLLLIDGFAPVVDAVHPRWALRAARIAVQGRLAADGAASVPDLRRALGPVAVAHGDRWNELIDEAILTHPDAHALLETLWPELAADRPHLKAMLEAAERLFVASDDATYRERVAHSPLRAGMTVEALQPLIEVLAVHDDDVLDSDSTIRGSALRLLRAYQRNVRREGWPARHHVTMTSLQRAFHSRATRRPRALDSELIALLGPRHRPWSEQALRALAANDPAALEEVVEAPGSVAELATHVPDLLADLAHAYYLTRPYRRTHRHWSSSSEDDGIREHSFDLVGIGTSATAGPFLALLTTSADQGRALIRAVVDRAAHARQATMASLAQPPAASLPQHLVGPFVLDVPALAGVELAGDEQAWRWYRGTGIGAHPAVSAMQALDRWAHMQIAAGRDPVEIINFVLDGATTIAEAGLAYGLMLRHRPATESLLVAWAHERLVSDLEIPRIQEERRTDPDAPGHEHLQVIPNAVATSLVLNAVATDNSAALVALDAAAEHLEATHILGDGTIPPEIRAAAALLRPDTYEYVEAEGHLLFAPHFDPALRSELDRDLAPGDSFLAAMQMAYDYSPSEAGGLDFTDRTTLIPADQQASDATSQMREEPDLFAARLRADLQNARSITAEGRFNELMGAGPVCTLAAWILTAELGATDDEANPVEASVTDDDRQWAVETLAAHAGDVSRFEDRSTTDHHAPSRAAARALPGVLAARSDLALDQRVIDALRALAEHPAYQTRATLVTALAQLWRAPCADIGGVCLHRHGLDITTRVIADAHRPAWDGTPGPAISAPSDLVGVDSDDVEHELVLYAAAAALEAGTATGCEDVRSDAGRMLDDLLSLVAVYTDGDMRIWRGFDQLAAAALRVDSQYSGSHRLQDVGARLWPTTHGFVRWRMSLLAAAETAGHERVEQLATSWRQLLTSFLDLEAGTPVGSDEASMVRIAALMPPAAVSRYLQPDLGGQLQRWVRSVATQSQVNVHALDVYAHWALATCADAASILDTLDVLVTDRTADTAAAGGVVALMEHLLSFPMSAAQQGRAHRWLDTFTTHGHPDLRRLDREA